MRRLLWMEQTVETDSACDPAGILPIIVLMSILAMGNIFNAGF